MFLFAGSLSHSAIHGTKSYEWCKTNVCPSFVSLSGPLTFNEYASVLNLLIGRRCNLTGKYCFKNIITGEIGLVI